MDPTISVSEGCFVFKNGATRATKARKRKMSEATPILGKDIIEQPFYEVYWDTWNRLKTHIEQLRGRNYKRITDDLLAYVAAESTGKLEKGNLQEILPTAALLTGINQPDHLEQFEALKQRISEKAGAFVCLVQARDCPSVKAAVETMVYNFIKAPIEVSGDRDYSRPRRHQYTIKQLKLWYSNNYASVESSNFNKRQALVVILPDFECFNASVLLDFIMILCAHCAQLPFILVLGIATSISAVHITLPFQVTSKLNLHVFQTQGAPEGLNEVLEQVILSPRYSFHLSGKAFKFLTHIFLYYDFSINRFVQSYKYCLMEHFFQGNAFALCQSYAASLTKIKSLNHDDVECIRRLLSFRPYVEKINDCKRIIAILTDDDYLKKKLPQLLRDCQLHFMIMRVFLEFLTLLVNDLPKCPLGKYRRELYVLCLSKEITSQAEFKECWQMLSFMSKDELVSKISTAIKTTQVFLENEIAPLELAADCTSIVNKKLTILKDLLTKVVMSGLESAQKETTLPNEQLLLKNLSSRFDLKQKLLHMSKQSKAVSEFTKSVNEVLNFIDNEIIKQYLTPLEQAPPLHELFFFDDISSVRKNIIGAPRAALHMALNNPQFYLQCKCCLLQENSQLLPTLPDLSVVYKLHLECGRMINIFDWLQAFRAVIDFSEEDHEQVDPQIQARFTRAVAELQFLGYIKMSKRKTDHATRLTW